MVLVVEARPGCWAVRGRGGRGWDAWATTVPCGVLRVHCHHARFKSMPKTSDKALSIALGFRKTTGSQP